VSLAVAEGLGGDPAEGSLSAVVGIHDDRVLGDVDSEDSVGVGLVQGEFLTGDHEEVGVRSTALGGDRRRLAHGPAGRRSRSIR
jgi:hypothetical protein